MSGRPSARASRSRRLAAPGVRSSTTRSDASGRRSRDHTIPATTQNGTSSETARPAVSSGRGVVPGGDHPDEPGQGRENAEGGGSQQRRLGALCGAAENEQAPYKEHEQHERDGDPEDRLDSVDSVVPGSGAA